MADQMRLYYTRARTYIYIYIYIQVYVVHIECNATSFDRPFDLSTRLTRKVYKLLQILL